jgi:hypothetical protein
MILSYLGNKFSHEQLRINANQASLPSDPANPSPIQDRRPYPWVGDVDEVAMVGSTDYNGLEAELNKQYSNGLSFLASYIWSKAMDYLGNESDFPQYGPDPKLDYGPSNFNQTNVFKFSPVYELPFGHNKPYLNGGNWVEKNLLGGIKTSGVLSVQSGMPFYVSANDLSDTGGDHDMRANQVCNGNTFQHTTMEWFNTSCYVQPSIGQFGNEIRNNINSPRNTNLDLSLFKSVPFRESDAMEFRSDFFSALNFRGILWCAQGTASSFRSHREIRPSVRPGQIRHSSWISQKTIRRPFRLRPWRPCSLQRLPATTL